jgi:hypothetical protein
MVAGSKNITKGTASGTIQSSSHGIFDRSKKLIDRSARRALSFGFVDQMPEMSNIHLEWSNNFFCGGTNPLFCRLSLRMNHIALTL